MEELVTKASAEVQVTAVSKFFIRKVLLAVCQSPASMRRRRIRCQRARQRVGTRWNRPGGGVLVFGGERGEVAGGFVEHNLLNGEDAMLEGVESGNGLSGGGARSGRFLRVGAAGCALPGSWHEGLV